MNIRHIALTVVMVIITTFQPAKAADNCDDLWSAKEAADSVNYEAKTKATSVAYAANRSATSGPFATYRKAQVEARAILRTTDVQAYMNWFEAESDLDFVKLKKLRSTVPAVVEFETKEKAAWKVYSASALKADHDLETATQIIDHAYEKAQLKIQQEYETAKLSCEE